MIEGGWPFINAAYAVTVLALGAAVLIVYLRARHWAKRAGELDQGK
jgi:hypothetical protein